VIARREHFSKPRGSAFAMLAVMSERIREPGSTGQQEVMMSIATLTSGHSANDAPAIDRQALLDRFLVATGLVGPLFFLLVVIVEGATRPGYNAWHDVISTLALGPGGWVLTAGLAVLGVLLVCFALGLRRVLSPGTGATWGPILIAVSGLAFIGEAIFASDPSLGYPPGLAATTSLHGSVHNILTVVFETPAVVAACIVLARRFGQAPRGRAWVTYTIVTLILVVVFQVLGVLAFLSSDPGWPFGLYQRLQFFTLQGWIAVVAARLLAGPVPEPA
jgi:hypothetical protein